jgi:stalled ribosome alternative rescue factor ArfA
MKPIQFTLPPVKQRAHRALFDRDLPFRGRVEKSKTEYRRKPKHQNRDADSGWPIIQIHLQY